LSDLLSIVLPVFALIALGYGAAQFGLLDKRAGDGLSEFVFTLATPALVMRTMMSAVLPETQPWGYWAAYFIGVAVVWAAAMLLSRIVFGASYPESVVAGFSAGQANTVLVGIPLILKAYGEAGAVPLFLLIAVHLPVTMTSATLLFEGRKGPRWTFIARRLALHPILLSLFAGLLARAFGLSPGGPVKIVLDGLAGAAVPCALVAMGLALQHHGVKGGLGQTLVITALKLVVHPAIVYALAFHVFVMPPVWAGVAVLFAAMPSGINAYLFAARYRTGEAIASSAIAVSTALALVSTFFWLWVLGIGT
jgi:malonate transporter